tara:strand:- start:1173 stop:1373 length:201 start_codon:yes stop_codon:yes gene_type:complete
MKNHTTVKIYCENREQFYLFTNKNEVTKWSSKSSEAKIFTSKEEANDLIQEFKNSAMGDTKYISIV